MLNFLRLRRADRESQHERTDLRTDLDETSALVLKSHAAAAPQAHKAVVRAKKFREISPDSRRNLREINERNVPSLGTKSGPPPRAARLQSGASCASKLRGALSYCYEMSATVRPATPILVLCLASKSVAPPPSQLSPSPMRTLIWWHIF